MVQPLPDTAPAQGAVKSSKEGCEAGTTVGACVACLKLQLARERCCEEVCDVRSRTLGVDSAEVVGRSYRSASVSSQSVCVGEWGLDGEGWQSPRPSSGVATATSGASCCCSVLGGLQETGTDCSGAEVFKGASPGRRQVGLNSLAKGFRVIGGGRTPAEEA